MENQLEGKVRFVTGTDCHDWSAYPAETPQDAITDFPYTYAQCLPTFKGLVMAITDHYFMQPSVDVVEYFKQFNSGIQLFVGEEVHPWRNGEVFHVVNLNGKISVNELYQNNQLRLEAPNEY